MSGVLDPRPGCGAAGCGGVDRRWRAEPGLHRGATVSASPVRGCDVGASLIGSHSDKQHAAGKYRYGFHALLAWCDNIGELLAVICRPDNAGARLEHLLSRNSANSSMPPSRDNDRARHHRWDRNAAAAGPGDTRASSRRRRRHLAWTDDPHRRVDLFPQAAHSRPLVETDCSPSHLLCLTGAGFIWLAFEGFSNTVPTGD